MFHPQLDRHAVLLAERDRRRGGRHPLLLGGGSCQRECRDSQRRE
jgi:hypothetical protein